jgi:hypothetical protein
MWHSWEALPHPFLKRRASGSVVDEWVSLLNTVEGFFAKLTRRWLKYGVFQSVEDLQSAIERFIAEHNETEAKPFTWTADPDKIIQARNRGFQTLESIH